MIVEGAFTKIPEVLIGYDETHYLYEAGITNLFSNAIILELNARNIDNPLSKVFFEKRYQSNVNERCDIFAKFEFINPQLAKYGYYPENWIEAKYFGNRDKKRGNETKSENAGSIAYDIYRLIRNIKYDNAGLYSLVLFDDNPQKYLAKTRQDGTKRSWVDNILTSGMKEFNFNLDEEPYTIKKIFERANEPNLSFKCKIRVSTFSPLNEECGYYGSLIQILEKES